MPQRLQTTKSISARGCSPHGAGPERPPSPRMPRETSTARKERPEERFPACPEHPGARAGQAGMGKDRQTPARPRVSPHAAGAGSHGVVENDVLFGQLQQHGVIEELADAHVLAQALQGKTANQTEVIPLAGLVAEIPQKSPCVLHYDKFSGSRGGRRIYKASGIAQQLEDIQQPLRKLQTWGCCC